MDEHDKRAREVVCEVRGVLPPLRSTAQEDREVLALIASALRSTAAAAVAAEREKWQPLAKAARAVMLAGKSDDPSVHDAAWGALRAALTAAPAAQGERPSVDLDTPWCLTVNGPMNVTPTLAGAISAALSPAPLASPAQAERVSDGVSGVPLPVQTYVDGATGKPFYVFSKEDVYAVRFETVTDAHARGCRETQARLAARLRARADEEQARAERLDVTAETRGTPEHERVSAGRVADLNHALAFALRAEADALEVGT